MKKLLKRVLLFLLLAFIVIQFFRIDKTNPEVIEDNDLIAMTGPSKEVENILRSACYDCHSNETQYPWYSNVAPVSWWLKHHIDEGREHLNFSEWGTYPEKKRNHKLEECAEEVEEGEMPLPSYTWTHSEAKLTSEQVKIMKDWFKSQMTEFEQLEEEEEVEGDED